MQRILMQIIMTMIFLILITSYSYSREQICSSKSKRY